MIYISSTASSKDKIKDAILELVQLGFLNIELSGGTKFYSGIENDLLDFKRKYNLNFLIHNYFPPSSDNFVMNVASRNKRERESTFGLIRKAIRLAKKLGNDLYTFHAGYDTSLSEKNGLFYKKVTLEEDGSKENTKADFYNSLDFLLSQVRESNFRLGVENFFPINGVINSFLQSPEDIVEFLKLYTEEPKMGLLLDLGHLEITANYLGFDKFKVIEAVFSKYPKKIFEIHISENNGSRDLHQLSDVNSWQIELISRNKFLRNIPIVFEWRRSSNKQTYRHFAELKKTLEN